jgi:DNA repair exonuclease SbcCD nuclease subunit
MRLCHFSDSHLGAGANHPRRGDSGLTLRQEDIVGAFEAAVDRIIALKPDLCIHSGDLFHQVRPLNTIMAVAGRALHRLADEAGIPTVIMTGNHDAPRQTHIGPALEIYRQIRNLHVATESRLHRFTFGDTTITMLPHCLTTGVQKAALAECRPDLRTKYNVLVLHGVVAGMPEFSMADLGEQEIAPELLEPFDYVALGHYHNYAQVGPRAFYAGSTERLSQAERASAKGLLEVFLEPFRAVFHEVPTRPMVDLPRIQAAGKRGDELAEEITRKLAEIDSPDKIVRVTISGVTEETLGTIPPGTLDRLRKENFQLDIRFEKESPNTPVAFGEAVGQGLEQKLVDFIRAADLQEFAPDRLVELARQYLHRVE